MFNQQNLLGQQPTNQTGLFANTQQQAPLNQGFFNQQNKPIFGNQSQQTGINSNVGIFNQTQSTSGVFGSGMTGSNLTFGNSQMSSNNQISGFGSGMGVNTNIGLSNQPTGKNIFGNSTNNNLVNTGFSGGIGGGFNTNMGNNINPSIGFTGNSSLFNKQTSGNFQGQQLGMNTNIQQVNGTYGVNYTPTSYQEGGINNTKVENIRIISIIGMSIFSQYSVEELRYLDYRAKKQGIIQTGQYNLGMNQQNSSGNIMGNLNQQGGGIFGKVSTPVKNTGMINQPQGTGLFNQGQGMFNQQIGINQPQQTLGFQKQTSSLFNQMNQPQITGNQQPMFNNQQQQSGLLSQGLFNQAAPQSGGILQNQTGFGNFNQQTSQTGGGLFGNQSNPAPGGIFGGQTNTNQATGIFSNQTTQPTSGMFGGQSNINQPTGGLFGGQTTSNQPSSGMFGNQTTQPTGGMFGNQTTQPTGGMFVGQTTTNQPTGGLFGGQTTTNQPTGGLFGAQSTTNQPTGGLFGGQTTTNQPTGGLFGAQPTTNQPTGGLFGAQPTTNQPSGGLFGGQTTTNQPSGGLFGGQTTTNQLQQNSTGLFGGNTTTTQTGSFSGITNAQNSSGNLFGGPTTTSQPSNNLFGSSNTSQPIGGLFGSNTNQTSGGLFSSNTNVQQSNLIGGISSQQAGIAGTNTSAGLFSSISPSTGGLFGGTIQQNNGFPNSASLTTPTNIYNGQIQPQAYMTHPILSLIPVPNILGTYVPNMTAYMPPTKSLDEILNDLQKNRIEQDILLSQAKEIKDRKQEFKLGEQKYYYHPTVQSIYDESMLSYKRKYKPSGPVLIDKIKPENKEKFKREFESYQKNLYSPKNQDENKGILKKSHSCDEVRKNEKLIFNKLKDDFTYLTIEDRSDLSDKTKSSYLIKINFNMEDPIKMNFTLEIQSSKKVNEIKSEVLLQLREKSKNFKKLNSNNILLMRKYIILKDHMTISDTGIKSGDTIYILIKDQIEKDEKDKYTDKKKKKNRKYSSVSIEGKDLAPLNKLPVLTKAGYKTIPDMREIYRMSSDELENVKNFTIYNKHGMIEFEGITDLSELNLDNIINIEDQKISVYKNDEIPKPEIGKGLNKPAILKMLKCFPEDEGEMSNEKYEAHLQSLQTICKDINAKFLKYDKDTGEFQFKVEHF